jgi:hypothetical protein
LISRDSSDNGRQLLVLAVATQKAKSTTKPHGGCVSAQINGAKKFAIESAAVGYPGIHSRMSVSNDL